MSGPTELRSARGNRVLITGAAGMIGSHLASLVIASGGSATAVDDFSGHRSAVWPAAIPSAAERHVLTVGHPDSAAVFDALVANADLVVHLASPIGVAHAHENPHEVARSILTAGAAVVDACRRHGAPLVYTSSSEAYGLQRRLELTEDLPPQFDNSPRWSYGRAKLRVERLVSEAALDGLPTWIARLFNVTGAHQRPETGLVVPSFCQAALERRPMVVHGDGRAVRAFASPHDVAAGLLRLAACSDLAGRPVNLGGTDLISIDELADKVAGVVGNHGWTRGDAMRGLGDGFSPVARRVPDLTLARRHLDWAPAVTLDEAIAACAGSMHSRVADVAA